jgi:hypothetical protein
VALRADAAVTAEQAQHVVLRLACQVVAPGISTAAIGPAQSQTSKPISKKATGGQLARQGKGPSPHLNTHFFISETCHAATLPKAAYLYKVRVSVSLQD